MTTIFAHRGLHLTATENTVAAFCEARSAGADGVELDVRRTKDGALVVHHDAEIEGVGAIADKLLRELPPGVATLDEAMAACEGVLVNVEIKNHPSEAVYDATGTLAFQVLGALRELRWLDRIVVSCFDLATCEAVRRADADVPVGWLLDWRVDAHPSVAMVAERGLNAIHPFFAKVDAELVSDAHQRGLDVNVWTVNGRDDMRAMFEFGVDTLITDDPVAAREVQALGAD